MYLAHKRYYCRSFKTQSKLVDVEVDSNQLSIVIDLNLQMESWNRGLEVCIGTTLY